jgi:hypothetical protein
MPAQRYWPRTLLLTIKWCWSGSGAVVYPQLLNQNPAARPGSIFNRRRYLCGLRSAVIVKEIGCFEVEE